MITTVSGPLDVTMGRREDSSVGGVEKDDGGQATTGHVDEKGGNIIGILQTNGGVLLVFPIAHGIFLLKAEVVGSEECFFSCSLLSETKKYSRCARDVSSSTTSRHTIRGAAAAAAAAEKIPHK